MPDSAEQALFSCNAGLVETRKFFSFASLWRLPIALRDAVLEAMPELLLRLPG